MDRRPCSSTRPTCISATTGSRCCARRSSASSGCGRDEVVRCELTSPRKGEVDLRSKAGGGLHDGRSKKTPTPTLPLSRGGSERNLMPKAMICRELGAPEVLRLEHFDSKPLAGGQVRVRVRAAGLNYPDVLMVAGEYQHKPPLPFVPGLESAGEVSEVADGVAGVAVGDRVIVKSRGALTEEIVVAPSALAPMPKNFDYAQGATFLAAHGTAYYGLVDRAQIRPGETLLVHGAAGGVGLAAV